MKLITLLNLVTAISSIPNVSAVSFRSGVTVDANVDVDVSSIVDNARDTVTTAVDNAGTTVDNVTTNTSTRLNTAVGNVRSTVRNTVDNSSATVGNVVDNANTTVGNVVDNANTTVGDAVTDARTTIDNAVGDVNDSATSILDRLTGVTSTTTGTGVTSTTTGTGTNRLFDASAIVGNASTLIDNTTTAVRDRVAAGATYLPNIYGDASVSAGVNANGAPVGETGIVASIPPSAPTIIRLAGMGAENILDASVDVIGAESVDTLLYQPGKTGLDLGLAAFSTIGNFVAAGSSVREPLPDEQEVTIRGGELTLVYRILGSGPTRIVSTPGGQTGLDRDPIPDAIFGSLDPVDWETDYSVLMWDRRNTGRSNVYYPTDAASLTEDILHAGDLKELLDHLGWTEVILIGNSAGSRQSLRFALEYPSMVEGMILRNPTGGWTPAEFLSSQYYTQYITPVENRGIDALLSSSLYASLAASRPENRDRVLSIDPDHFVAVMTLNSDLFLNTADEPVLGLQESALVSITVPTLVVHCQVPDDGMHTEEASQALSDILPNSTSNSPVFGTYDETFASGGWPLDMYTFLESLSA